MLECPTTDYSAGEGAVSSGEGAPSSGCSLGWLQAVIVREDAIAIAEPPSYRPEMRDVSVSISEAGASVWLRLQRQAETVKVEYSLNELDYIMLRLAYLATKELDELLDKFAAVAAAKSIATTVAATVTAKTLE